MNEWRDVLLSLRDPVPSSSRSTEATREFSDVVGRSLHSSENIRRTTPTLHRNATQIQKSQRLSSSGLSNVLEYQDSIDFQDDLHSVAAISKAAETQRKLERSRSKRKLDSPATCGVQCDQCNKKLKNVANLKVHKMYVHSGERPFNCMLCSKRFVTIPALRCHERSHTDERPYPCGECGRSFHQSAHLSIHRKFRHLTIARKFPCTYCTRRFMRLAELTIHERTHTGERPFACKHCDRRFGQKQTCLKHEKLHEAPAAHKCPLCDVVVSRIVTLRDHMRALHTEERPYSCKLCDRTFARSCFLRYHLRHAHIGERPYACDQCERTFCLSSELERHKASHTNLELFCCEICERIFSTAAVLAEHKLTHIVVNPITLHNFPCELCARRFSSQENLDVHIRSHTDKQPFACKYCDRQFSRRYACNSHELLHVAPPELKCPFCDHVGTCRRTLNYHMRVKHTDERPCVCTVCNNVYSSWAGLRYHSVYGHCGESPYACDQCEQRFQLRVELERHRYSHAELPVSDHRFEHCERSFTMADLLVEHNLVTHTGSRIYRCAVCDELHPTASSLHEHYQCVHGFELTLQEIVDSVSITVDMSDVLSEENESQEIILPVPVRALRAIDRVSIGQNKPVKSTSERFPTVVPLRVSSDSDDNDNSENEAVKTPAKFVNPRSVLVLTEKSAQVGSKTDSGTGGPVRVLEVAPVYLGNWENISAKPPILIQVSASQQNSINSSGECQPGVVSLGACVKQSCPVNRASMVNYQLIPSSVRLPDSVSQKKLMNSSGECQPSIVLQKVPAKPVIAIVNNSKQSLAVSGDLSALNHLKNTIVTSLSKEINVGRVVVETSKNQQDVASDSLRLVSVLKVLPVSHNNRDIVANPKQLVDSLPECQPAVVPLCVPSKQVERIDQQRDTPVVETSHANIMNDHSYHTCSSVTTPANVVNPQDVLILTGKTQKLFQLKAFNEYSSLVSVLKVTSSPTINNSEVSMNQNDSVIPSSICLPNIISLREPVIEANAAEAPFDDDGQHPENSVRTATKATYSQDVIVLSGKKQQDVELNIVSDGPGLASVLKVTSIRSVNDKASKSPSEPANFSTQLSAAIVPAKTAAIKKTNPPGVLVLTGKNLPNVRSGFVDNNSMAAIGVLKVAPVRPANSVPVRIVNITKVCQSASVSSSFGSESDRSKVSEIRDPLPASSGQCRPTVIPLKVPPKQTIQRVKRFRWLPGTIDKSYNVSGLCNVNQIGTCNEVASFNASLDAQNTSQQKFASMQLRDNHLKKSQGVVALKVASAKLLKPEGFFSPIITASGGSPASHVNRGTGPGEFRSILRHSAIADRSKNSHAVHDAGFSATESDKPKFATLKELLNHLRKTRGIDIRTKFDRMCDRVVAPCDSRVVDQHGTVNKHAVGKVPTSKSNLSGTKKFEKMKTRSGNEQHSGTLNIDDYYEDDALDEEEEADQFLTNTESTQNVNFNSSFQKNSLKKNNRQTKKRRLAGGEETVVPMSNRGSLDGPWRQRAPRRRNHEGSHPCLQCHRRFSSRWYMLQHTKIHRPDFDPSAIPRVECSQCSRSFRSKSELVNHQRLHTGERPFACPHCDKRFYTAHLRWSHQAVHAGQRPFACSQCDKRFARNGELKTHQRTHTGERPYACRQCSAAFAQSFTRAAHEKTHELPKNLCTMCDKRFTRLRSLHQHVAAMHTSEKSFACDKCQKCYVNAVMLRRHVRNSHSSFDEEEGFKGVVLRPGLGKKRPRPNLVTNPTGLNGIGSDACEDTVAASAICFLTDCDVIAEEEVQAERRFACTECNKRFAHASLLKYHLRTHTGERPFVCRQCGAAFTQKSLLTLHERTHGAPQHLCTTCDRRFSRLTSLRQHIACAHAGEKPFACDKCDKCYVSSALLRRHLSGSHRSFGDDEYSANGVVLKLGPVMRVEEKRQSGLSSDSAGVGRQRNVIVLGVDDFDWGSQVPRRTENSTAAVKTVLSRSPACAPKLTAVRTM